METLDDYKVWLNEVDLEPTDWESVGQLVHALKNKCECGLFNVKIANGANNGWIIYATGVDDTLHLTTDKQIRAFITHLEVNYCEGMDAEAYASFKHNMQKND